MKNKTLSATILALSLISTTSPVLANDASSKDNKDLSTMAAAQLSEGKIEGALLINPHLNNFKIDVDVKNNQAILSGKVNSSAEKDLAGEIADSIDGIDTVDNQLTVVKQKKPSKDDEKMSSTIKDASITAAVKVKLLANTNVSGIDVNVETKNRVVTLKGKVASSIESDLAEKITSNVDDVESVNNKLKVSKS